MRISKKLLTTFAAALFFFGIYPKAEAQSVTPLIAEYTRQGDGFFEVTNSAAVPQVVVLEPKSFDVQPDGTGVFRPLDTSIDLQLSTTSLRLAPQQTARVFYKVKAQSLPAWFCIYAAFTTPKKTEGGVNVRIMLPHTVYVYQREGLTRNDIAVSNVQYDVKSHRVLFDLTNRSKLASRAQEMEITGKGDSKSEGGFPILPGGTRKLSIDWTGENAPQNVSIRFREFSMKLPVTTVAE